MSDSSKPIIQRPKDFKFTLLLAHGAGAAMDSPFMNAIAADMSNYGHQVIRFEFPYMAKRRTDGKRRPPDRMPVLEQSFCDTIDQVAERPLIIGGKSMGGRVATMIADRVGVDGVVCLGYPFHPPGKPDNLRTEHLKTIQTNTLILQGTRDTFGSRPEVTDYRLSKTIRIAWLDDGDHSFKPRKKSGISLEDNLGRAAAEINAFMNHVTKGS